MEKENMTKVAVSICAEETIITNNVFDTLMDAAKWALGYDMSRYMDGSGYYGVEFTTGQLVDDPNLPQEKITESDRCFSCECDGSKFYITYFDDEDEIIEIGIEDIARELRITIPSLTNDMHSNIEINLLKKYSKKYPGIWNTLDKIHNIKVKKDNSLWNDLCYMPSYIVKYAIHNEGSTSAIFEKKGDAIVLSVLASWRRSKEVFVFDKDMESLLDNMEMEEIPTESFLKIPYPCIYVKLHDDTFGDRPIDGFFTQIECNGKDKYLWIIFVFKDMDTLDLIIHIDAKTIKDSWERMFSFIEDQIGTDYAKIARYIMCHGCNLQSLSNKALQMILYICCETAH